MDILWNEFISDKIVAETTHIILNTFLFFFLLTARLTDSSQHDKLNSAELHCLRRYLLIIQSKLCSYTFALIWQNTSWTKSLSLIADCHKHGSHIDIKLNTAVETSNSRHSTSSICFCLNTLQQSIHWRVKDLSLQPFNVGGLMAKIIKKLLILS